MTTAAGAIPPHGGSLVERLLGAQRAEAAKREAAELPFVTLDERQQCELELLVTGAYSPLEGFMTRLAYESVLREWRLPEGLPWGMPVVLDVGDELARSLTAGQRVALRDREGVNLAVMTVHELWRPDPIAEARALFGPSGAPPRGRRAWREPLAGTYLGGPVEGLAPPVRYGFDALYQPPRVVRAESADRGEQRVLAVHTAEPVHRFECEHSAACAGTLGAGLALHPADGGGDFDSLERMARLRSYRGAADALGRLARLYLLPYVPRGTASREGLLHAIVRQNYGFSHLVSYEARALEEERSRLDELLGELEIEPLEVEPHVYDPRRSAFVPRASAPTGEAVPSPVEAAGRLERGCALPGWYSYPTVLAALAAAHRPPQQQGIVIFFTGLSGSGKSTIARYVFGRLLEDGARPVTLLDGDVVRQHLSSELGFSKAHRDLNVRRIGYVAAEIAKNGGAAICAPIAPYAATRAAVRELVERNGAFIEVHVATPLTVCEARDRKGLYALARAGKLAEFTGVSDPYEEPREPTLRIDTTETSAAEAGEQVLARLRAAHYLRTP